MSENTEKTVRIYTGSDIMAEALVGRLKEANITPILRDDEQSGVMFGSGSKYDDQVRIFGHCPANCRCLFKGNWRMRME